MRGNQHILVRTMYNVFIHYSSNYVYVYVFSALIQRMDVIVKSPFVFTFRKIYSPQFLNCSLCDVMEHLCNGGTTSCVTFPFRVFLLAASATSCCDADCECIHDTVK